LFDENQLKDLLNQKNIALGIKFYPLERTCQNNKHYKHPVFQTYIVPSNYQQFAQAQDNGGEFLGFVDAWTGSSWSERNLNVTGGGFEPESALLKTVVEKDFWVYQENSQLKSRCLVYPRPKTYSEFLNKYYRLPTT
jgi:hypothetical protein